ncbi:hypothetical protein B4110_1482 [Parageobacillus toebii]|uniref:Uncharacterized protein n=1 Tax=Parageobacillus toebii TaxID=153151 RepID=A0A150N1Y1_9BACL|nr:hypothetical protein B4110_1482 [Parageobacillus toebii]
MIANSQKEGESCGFYNLITADASKMKVMKTTSFILLKLIKTPSFV